MRSFTCPKCKIEFALHEGTIEKHEYDEHYNNFYKKDFDTLNFYTDQQPTTIIYEGKGLEDLKPRNVPVSGFDVYILNCPRDSCGQVILLANSYGDFPLFFGQISPKPEMSFIPEFVPSSIREDIQEAEAILHLSPKASATLSRRALQGMIRDFFSIRNKRNLRDEIDAIKNDITQDEFDALTSLRSIGNIGAHPEKDESINLILDIDEHEAEQLVMLIHHFVESWYIKRERSRKLLESVKNLKTTKDNLKNSV